MRFASVGLVVFVAACSSSKSTGTHPLDGGGTSMSDAADVADASASLDAGDDAGFDAAVDADALVDASPLVDASVGTDAAFGDPRCALPGVSLVYVFANDNTIYSFDPTTKAFAKVVTPSCGASSPNSMAIDRNLVAWINYLSPAGATPKDYIYKVDLTKGPGCVASGIPSPAGYTQLGMAFSTDGKNAQTETLYVDGINGGELAKVDMTQNVIVPIGNFSNDTHLTGQSCELTGTGNGSLYGYFTTSPYVRIAQLDKTNAHALSDQVLTGFAPPEDWAFAVSGDDFYLASYPNASNTSTSSIVQYDPATMADDLKYVPSSGITIIGAGVSTCVPTTL